MSNILLITSSPRGDLSHSKETAQKLVEKLRASSDEVTIISRDLNENPVPHIDTSYVGAAYTPEADLTSEHYKRLELSDKLIEEFLWADTLVIATGMVNFGIPSTLKSWLDHVIRPGKTFSYNENGVAPLVTGKKGYIVASSGGFYSSGPMAANNFHDTHLKAALGFVGIQDIDTIFLEGVAYGPEALETALNKATEQIEAVA